MKSYYADLHIHIGRTVTGKPVKITGSKTLTFTNIIHHAKSQKGLDIIGIIDCHSPEVITEIEGLLHEGVLQEHEDGGLLFGDMMIILGSELEIYDQYCHGPIHVLSFFPTLSHMKAFSNWLSFRMKNIQLSSQRVYIEGRLLQQKVKELDGLFIPAHVFTPFKSLYGKGVKHSLSEVFDPQWIDAIELGLSANTEMADRIAELHDYPFITNSDAHSLAKIAREYQRISLQELSFKELTMALQQTDGRTVEANYGLDPLLGKYHETVCAKCGEAQPLRAVQCSNCGSKKIIKGVKNRIQELANVTSTVKGRKRPPYIHQIPLEFIPGIGVKTLEKLLLHYGTEMVIIHDVPLGSLQQVIPEQAANLIEQARLGSVQFDVGGGGRYGRVRLD
ncbi:endonuclease Q family protein [Cytobacillus sp. FSL K6-0265]|uniref:endonuclease Q family protein n=1 Tax=Cytobacillus sp. FSL K6-0265 TaxID=2921448 RepID=UPI0030FA1F80